MSPQQTAIKSTVRNRKTDKKMNTQRYLPFAEIRNDVVVLKNGGLRAVLRVEPVNFNLKSETEQQGIISGYESFINTLVFPIQIVARSSAVNIDPYLELIAEKAGTQSNELLKNQAKNYAEFIQKIVDVADIMQKRFYVVIPLDDAPQKKGTLARFFEWMNIDDTITRALQRSKKLHDQSARIRERVDLVQTGLNNIGLVSHRLNTLQLINVLYSMYNPDISQTQKLPGDGVFNTVQNVL